MSRGSAVIESIVVGFIAALLLLQVTSAAARIQSTGDELTEIAQSAALFAAHHGDAELAESLVVDLKPDASVSAWMRGSDVVVRVEAQIPLVGPEGSPVTITIAGEASARMSPFRSMK